MRGPWTDPFIRETAEIFSCIFSVLTILLTSHYTEQYQSHPSTGMAAWTIAWQNTMKGHKELWLVKVWLQNST